MIVLAENRHARLLLNLCEVTNPTETIHVAFDFNHKMIAVTMEVLAFAIDRSFKLVSRFKIEMFSYFCFQDSSNLSRFATL